MIQSTIAQAVVLLFFNSAVHLIKKIIDWLLYTSLFAALCAISLCLATERLVLMHVPDMLTPLHIFIAGCTMMVYNAHFLISRFATEHTERNAWSSRYRIGHYIVFAAGVLCSGISLFFLSWEILVACIVLGGLSFMYTMPLLPLKTRLRDFGWMKIITLTLVWTIVTSILPILYWDKALTDYPFEILMRFIFMFILCVAFDIRDMQKDLESNIYTIPNRIGINNSKRLINAGLIVFAILCTLQYLRYPNVARLVAEVAIAIITWIVIRYCTLHPSDKNYLGLVDGMMLLYGIAMISLT